MYGRQSAASQYSRTNPSYTAASSKRAGRGKKIALCVVAAVLVAVIGAGTAFALYINSINDQLNRGTKTQEELDAITDALAPKVSSNFTEPFYMMLIGSDRREDGSVEGARSDTNIVVRVDPTQNLVTMVSIPRDTCIEIDGYGQNKFNAAYNFGGAAGTIREASELCNVEISHYAEVNFEELVALVDAVGGVDVEVDERIDDPDAGSIVIEEGTQHLDGEAALVFARSRAYVDGDFTRTANQRKLIMAIVEKVLALPVTELPGVIQSASQCVTTDLSVNDILSLAQQFKDEGDLTIYSGMVPSTTGWIGQISYVFTDEAALKEMMEVVEAGEDPSGIVSSGVISTPGVRHRRAAAPTTHTTTRTTAVPRTTMIRVTRTTAITIPITVTTRATIPGMSTQGTRIPVTVRGTMRGTQIPDTTRGTLTPPLTRRAVWRRNESIAAFWAFRF